MALSPSSGAKSEIETLLDYYPYGKVLREYHIDGNERYMTTQHERDQETQLDYRGARFYDGDIGRFLSLDPLAADYPSLSDYVYVANNPIIFVDPDGRKITFASESDAKRVIADVNAIFRDKFGIDYDVLTYKNETIEDTMLLIFPADREVSTVVTNSEFDWNSDEYTIAIYDVINAQEEVRASLVNSNPEQGQTGEDFVSASRNAVNYVDDPSTKNYTVGGIFLHEVTYHKSPNGKKEYLEMLKTSPGIATQAANNFRKAYGLKTENKRNNFGYKGHHPQPSYNPHGINANDNSINISEEEKKKLDDARLRTGKK